MRYLIVSFYAVQHLHRTAPVPLKFSASETPIGKELGVRPYYNPSRLFLCEMMLSKLSTKDPASLWEIRTVREDYENNIQTK